MTQEERQARNRELAGTYVPRLMQMNPEEELGDLSLQDLLTVIGNAEWCRDNAFEMKEEEAAAYTAKIDEVKAYTAKRLLAADRIWVIYDQVTDMPYFDEEAMIYAFSEEEYAVGALDYFAQRYRNWRVEVISRENIYNFLGRTFYMDGALGVLLDNGQNYIRFAADSLVEAPDWTGVAEISIPLHNPDYMRALILFQQERGWRADYESKGEKLAAMETEMIRTFAQARFLIPVKGMDQAVKTGENQATIQKDTEIQIPTLTADNGRRGLPVFTDWTQFEKVYSKNEWGGWIWEANSLSHVDAEDVIINLNTVSFVASREMVAQMLDIYEKELKQQ